MRIRAEGIELTAADRLPEGAREQYGRLRLCLSFGFLHARAEQDFAGLENWVYGHQGAARLRIGASKEARLRAMQDVIEGWS